MKTGRLTVVGEAFVTATELSVLPYGVKRSESD